MNSLRFWFGLVVGIAVCGITSDAQAGVRGKTYRGTINITEINLRTGAVDRVSNPFRITFSSNGDLIYTDPYDPNSIRRVFASATPWSTSLDVGVVSIVSARVLGTAYPGVQVYDRLYSYPVYKVGNVLVIVSFVGAE